MHAVLTDQLHSNTLMHTMMVVQTSETCDHLMCCTRTMSQSLHVLQESLKRCLKVTSAGRKRKADCTGNREVVVEVANGSRVAIDCMHVSDLAASFIDSIGAAELPLIYQTLQFPNCS